MLKRIALTALVTAWVRARWIEPRSIELTCIEIGMPHLPQALDGYRIAHISDIHNQQNARFDLLPAAAALIDSQSPDMIAITGDFITGWKPFSHERLVDGLGRLHAPDGVFAVLGNHDYGMLRDADTVRDILQQCGIQELCNSYLSIQHGDAVLHIAGIDDVIRRQAHLERVLCDLPEDGCAILLAHEPDFADVSAASDRFDLQLSGHSHGGQVRLPLLGAPVSTTHARRYVQGLHSVHNMLLYVNRGLGTVTLPVRFLCPPEVTVLTLRSIDYIDCTSGA